MPGSGMRVGVRRVAPADLPAVAALRWRWSVDENGTAPRMTPDEYAAGVAAWAREHADSHVGWVAAEGEDLVGMTWIALTARFPTERSLARWTADLQSVYVVPEARGRGIGGALVRAALDEAVARGAERAVVHSTDAAIGLYEHLGFASGPRLLDRRLP